MEYSFKYTLTEYEYADFNEFTSWAAPWQRKARIKYFLVLFINCLVFSFIVSYTMRKKSNSDSLLMLIIIPLFISLVISSLFFINAKSSIRNKATKFLSKEENKDVLSECELVILEEKITDTNKKISATYSWDAIVRYAQTTNYFILYINAMYGIIIPKRLFSDTTQINEFDKFISSKIPLSSSFRSIGAQE